jgi:hypothetical protein
VPEVAYLDDGSTTLIPLRATADGHLHVDAEGEEDSVVLLLKQLVWEVRELRRAFCEDTRTFFKEYPG